VRTRSRATQKAKIAYQDFLAAWKDADPDVPVLKEAKAEYGKLRNAGKGSAADAV
jgi:hypothetical protein